MAETPVEPKVTQDVKLELAQKIFLAKTPDPVGQVGDRLKQEILDLIFENNMAPMYEKLCSELNLSVDSTALDRMSVANKSRLEELDAALKVAEENAGDMEVRDSLQAKADYLASIFDRQGAAAAYNVTETKTAGAGPKMDLVFSMLRLELSLGQWHSVKDLIDKAKQLCDKGGDWERKNRLRVYEAVFAMANRQFNRAAQLFLDAIPTFTANELMSYEQCVFYTIVLAPITLDRPDLKGKVIDSPEILAVIDVLPHARQFLHSLHGCSYADFFKAFASLCDAVRSDRYLFPHIRYWMREVRVAAYCQFLEPYRSVTLDAMASSFGVGSEFLDSELSDFIVAGRIPAKIDRVSGVVETNRPDAKNALYQQSIKHGDLLLTRLQKLSKIVDVEV